MSLSRRDVLRLLGSTCLALGGAGRALAAMPGGASGGDASSGLFAAYASEDRQSFGLGTLAESGTTAWRQLAGSRLHGGSLRPGSADLAVVARRPGAFFLVVDARDGALVRTVAAQPGRYFLGHAVFSADGDWLFATEGISDTGAGLVGVYDVRKGYARTAEWATGGPDPHELVLSEDGQSLWVANGGLELSPETGRAVLNERGIQSSVARLDMSGRMADALSLAPELSSLSIRHIALSRDGALLFACQEQGDVAEARPLLGRADTAGRIALIAADDAPWHSLNGYLGSIAADSSGEMLASTSPRGNCVWFQSIADPTRNWRLSVDDVCGVAPLDGAGQFLLTSGLGAVILVHLGETGPAVVAQSAAGVRWDNHVIRRTQGAAMHGSAHPAAGTVVR